MANFIRFDKADTATLIAADAWLREFHNTAAKRHKATTKKKLYERRIWILSIPPISIGIRKRLHLNSAGG